MFGVVQLCSNLLDFRQLATPQNAKVQKTAKFGDFRLARGRQNKPIESKIWHASVLIPWVCSSTPNAAIIGKGTGYSSPQISKFAQNCEFFVPGR